ncbi:hypothetical protein Ddye_005161, partial [Dipteronia dyeriana]
MDEVSTRSALSKAIPPTLASDLPFQVGALLDTGAMHNSIFVAKAKRLGLHVTNSECVDAKTANTVSSQPNGTMKGVTIHLGRWS